MFLLWKDHTAVAEAEEINRLARSWGGPDYTKYVGGIYSSEWFWAKACTCCGKTRQVAQAADTVLEHCDWMPAVLTAARISRRYGGAGAPPATRRCGTRLRWFPADEFLARLQPAACRR